MSVAAVVPSAVCVVTDLFNRLALAYNRGG